MPYVKSERAHVPMKIVPPPMYPWPNWVDLLLNWPEFAVTVDGSSTDAPRHVVGGCEFVDELFRVSRHYTAELARKHQETWRNRGKADRAKSAGGWQDCGGHSRAQSLSEPTTLGIGFPVPNVLFDTFAYAAWKPTNLLFELRSSFTMCLLCHGNFRTCLVGRTRGHWWLSELRDDDPGRLVARSRDAYLRAGAHVVRCGLTGVRGGAIVFVVGGAMIVGSSPAAAARLLGDTGGRSSQIVTKTAACGSGVLLISGEVMRSSA